MPRLLDLFCGAGGAAVGYARAGFDVVGVDVSPQPHYPFEFHQADAMTFPLNGFDAVHASPPCHDYSTVTGRNRKAKGVKGTAWMLPEILCRLEQSGVVWVVENVPAARTVMGEPTMQLCGSSFGLNVRRHRLFRTSHLTMAVRCEHHLQKPRFRSLDSRQKTLATVVGVHGHLNYPGELELRREAMGIDWMSTKELSQAIPPAYTEYIGRQLLEQL